MVDGVVKGSGWHLLVLLFCIIHSIFEKETCSFFAENRAEGWGGVLGRGVNRAG